MNFWDAFELVLSKLEGNDKQQKIMEDMAIYAA